ncbi:LPXTG-domain-containing protein cell wall anchor domain, partial [Enterococcus faecium EnGen0263]|uniref:MSCRAMM family protein n=1 Tax=Enterococcus faecium TaxID=1352 RepID=UPI00032E22C6
YQLVETKAPTGYDLDEKPVSFTIEKGQKEAVKVIKTNRRKTNSILLEKIDSKTGERLPNAVFMIRDRSNGKAIQKDLKTDKFGYLSIEGLSEGSYELIEVKAPKGYILDNTPVEFNISNQVSMEKLTKVNVPKNSVNISKNNNNSFPKTGEQDQSYLITVGIIILVLLFGVIISMILLQKMNNK